MDRTRMSWLTTAILVGVAALFLVMAASPGGSASSGGESAFEATPLERPPSTAMLSAVPVLDEVPPPDTAPSTTTSVVVIVEDVDIDATSTSEAPPVTSRPRRSTSRATTRGTRSAPPSPTTTAAPATASAAPGPTPAPSTTSTTSTTAANRGPAISGASLSRQWIHEQCAGTSRPTTLTVEARVEDSDGVSSIAARLSSGPVRQVSMGSGNGQATATIGGYSPATVQAGGWMTITVSIEAVDGRGARSRTQVGTITLYDNPDCG